ncbi:hypothetical protein [Arthrobacter celericrescens]|uniref:hypothetical protein n=1 Tax=Arthrobacter celericrescens TaxID=2320851 RepID=UPI001FDF1363|nr:hypothetical protein [Arthrobacter celericrescens]
MKRSVQFWRIDQMSGEGLFRPFPARRVAEVLREAEDDGVDRHFRCADGTVLLAQAAAVAPFPVLLLDRVRGGNLPSVGDSAGRRKALPLDAGDHLLETTYFAFLKRNVLAVLGSGNGPRAARLGEYLGGMLGLEPGLVPVVREDVEDILERLDVSRFEFSLPAGRLSGTSMGGEWADVLDSASRLMSEGTFRVSLSVGRSGSARDKQRIRERIQHLIEVFRRAGSMEQFDHVVAEGKNSVSGDREVVDLLKERFISYVDVDADAFNDPARAAAEAVEILRNQAQNHEEFFARTLPEVTGMPDNSVVPRLAAATAMEQATAGEQAAAGEHALAGGAAR